MTPTAKLRFVNSKETFETGHVTSDGHRFLGVRYVHKLQQWWEHTEWNAEGEWRDVPLEQEQE